MKKVILLAIVLSVVSASTYAAEKRINLYGAYVFDDNFSSSYDTYNYYDGKIVGGFQYGAGLEFLPREDMGVELLWVSQSTTAPTHYLSSGLLKEKYAVLDLNLNFAMLAFNHYAKKPGSKVEGYGTLMLGCLFANAENPETGGSSSGEKFSWGLRLGTNIWASEKVGIKIQGQLLSAVQSVGGSLYFGTGGSGAGVSTYSSMLQFSIGGGLVFNLGK